jgi:hypothetical protein
LRAWFRDELVPLTGALCLFGLACAVVLVVVVQLPFRRAFRGT